MDVHACTTTYGASLVTRYDAATKKSNCYSCVEFSMYNQE